MEHLCICYITKLRLTILNASRVDLAHSILTSLGVFTNSIWTCFRTFIIVRPLSYLPTWKMLLLPQFCPVLISRCWNQCNLLDNESVHTAFCYFHTLLKKELKVPVARDILLLAKQIWLQDPRWFAFYTQCNTFFVCTRETKNMSGYKHGNAFN